MKHYKLFFDSNFGDWLLSNRGRLLSNMEVTRILRAFLSRSSHKIDFSTAVPFAASRLAHIIIYHFELSSLISYVSYIEFNSNFDIVFHFNPISYEN